MVDMRFHIPKVDTHLIEARGVGQTYQIQVMQPLMRRGEAERFPVLYLTDGNLNFELAKAISHSLQVAGLVRRFILVGIGYPGDNPFAGTILRCRDFTTLDRPVVSEMPRSVPIEGVPGLEQGEKNWHGAAEFLAFIRDELAGLIDRTYPTLPADRAYAGHSMGGSLGLHALFGHPGMFRRFVISSPTISYDGDDFGLREARKCIESRPPLDAQVFMTVGEQEEFETAPPLAKPQFVSSFYRLAALLRGAQLPGLKLNCAVFPGETHASVLPIAFTRGVQWIYGPADRPPLSA